MSKVKDFLPWVALMTKLPKKERQNWVQTIFDGIKSYRGKTAKKSIWLSDMLADSKEFELVGFAANVSYVKIDGTDIDLSALFVHPWGTPTLLLKHKTLPLIVMSSPSLRYDQTLLAETGSDRALVKGFTG